jgi:heme-degrading monooxygenase HmoA
MVILIVQFRQKGTSVARTRATNEAVVPLIDAQPGFRSKLWLGSDETGEYAGVYEFETREDAEAYVRSDVVAVLRALPTLDGEVTCKVYELYREQRASASG